MDTQLINATPHAVTFSGVIDGQPQMITIPPSGINCRVDTESHSRGMIDGYIPIQKQVYGRINHLPERQPNTHIIVSGLVLHAMRIQGMERDDVIAPATGPRDNALRDNDGRILAVALFNTP
jgi:hypothetical protein